LDFVTIWGITFPLFRLNGRLVTGSEIPDLGSAIGLFVNSALSEPSGEKVSAIERGEEVRRQGMSVTRPEPDDERIPAAREMWETLTGTSAGADWYLVGSAGTYHSALVPRAFLLALFAWVRALNAGELPDARRIAPPPWLERPGWAPRLYLITDRHATGGRPLTDVVAAALSAVAGRRVATLMTAVQLREKDLSGRELTKLAHELRDVTARAGVRLFINDRIDVALAIGANGVHLSGTSLDPRTVAAVAPDLEIAVSAHAPAEVAALHATPGNRRAFALLGPIRDTPSKRAFGPPLGDAAVTEAARTGVPIVAVGGVGPEHARALRAAGAHGVACIRAVMAAPDPAAAVDAFCQELI